MNGRVWASLSFTMLLWACGHGPRPESIFRQAGQVQGEKLIELSGLVPALAEAEYWGLNDSGDTATLYRFNDQGQMLQIVNLEGAINRDWEGMTRDEAGNLYVADFGDNAHKHSPYPIYKLAEPAPGVDKVDGVTAYSFEYTDGQSHNCEAIFFFDNKLYVIVKEGAFDVRPGIYCIDRLESGKTVTAREVGELEIQGQVTDAAYSAEHGQLAVLTYHGIAFYSLKEEADLLKPPIHFTFGQFGQCEALCYDGDSLVVTNEPGKFWKHPINTFLGLTQVTPALPTCVLARAPRDPTIDGKLDDWEGDRALSLSGTKGEPARAVRVLWTNAGLYGSFRFTKSEPTPSVKEKALGDTLFLMLSTDGQAKFPSNKTSAYLVTTLKEPEGIQPIINRRPYLNPPASKMPKDPRVGRVAMTPDPKGTTVEFLIEAKDLPEGRMIPGGTYRLNLCLFEPTETGYSMWSWTSSLADITDELPFTWGELNLTMQP